MDFIIKSEHNNSTNLNNLNNLNNNLNNNIHIIVHSYFPNIIITKKVFEKAIIYSQIDLDKNSPIIYNFFTEFIIGIFKNGTESQSKNIFKIFKKFLENRISKLNKICFSKNKYLFNDLFKTIFIPLMKSFNKEYNKNEKKISLKKYLLNKEIDGEKIGGTIKHIFDVYPK